MRDRIGECAGSKRGATDRTESDRSQQVGVEVRLITDRNGLPLSLGISGASMHDKQGPYATRARRPRPSAPLAARVADGPGKLHADKGYEDDHLRRWFRERGIRHRITRKRIESSQRLGRHRWVVGKGRVLSERLPTPPSAL
ncbi:IS5 family transposase [Streptomyces sindenensis]|nr:IS5 family transposase [Streptomyces sindenensis]